jgi:cell division transport system permease protein
MSKRKVDAKTFAQQKRTRRQWLTFIRMCRYGVNNFSRNTWLTVAATAVMTITLLIIFVTLSARNILIDSLSEISKSVDMSIYLKKDTTDSEASKIKASIEKLESVNSASYITPEQAREEVANQNKNKVETLDALNEASNELPGTIRVKLININDTTELDAFVQKDKLLNKHVDPSREPSFSGGGKETIQTIASWVGFAEKMGLLASTIFIVLSSLIVFNTIRMAIFNRKEEIQMMKLIGADKSFIRGPFIVEAIVYGFIAALVATGLGVVILMGAKDGLTEFGIIVQPTIDVAVLYSPFVLIAMIVAGSLIGVISSLFATRKYLKIS